MANERALAESKPQDTGLQQVRRLNRSAVALKAGQRVVQEGVG